MISFRQFRVRAKNLFKKRQEVDPLRPVFSISKNSIKWRCKLCDHLQNTPIAKHDTTLIIICENCGKKHQVSDNGILIRKLLGSYQEEIIYVTNATAKELFAKIKNDDSIFIRPRLIYHTKYECELAHKDFVVDGVLVALNSGVRKHLPNDFLNLCKGCAGVKFIKCPRCGGEGYIRRYKHIEGGICFRCWGAKYEEGINIELKNIN